MTRAVVTAVVGVFVLAGCSLGGSSAPNPYGESPACPLLAQLAETGRTVARADVSDPNAFEATMRVAVGHYVDTATKLRATVPKQLRGDVERMITAVRHQRFDAAVRDRAAIDSFARASCRTPA